MTDTKISQRIISAASTVFPRIKAVRRRIHRIPELSGHEHNTAKLVYSYCSSIGASPAYHASKTGVSAVILNGNGPSVVLRADMDALPIQEKNSVSYKSQRRGIMHACGHDMHTAALLGAVEILVKLKDCWHGTVTALFQPSEEMEPGGALSMINEGAFPKKADCIFGLHVSNEHETGQIGIKSGIECSGETVFDVKVTGRGGHGALPHMTIDPIVCAASMILDLQTLISRECPAFEPAVLTVGSLHAGTKNNIIPDDAVFFGTIRTFSGRLQKLLKRRVKQCLINTAKSFRTTVDVSFHDAYPSGYNDPALATRAQSALSALLGKRNVIMRSDPTMFSEDFSYYQQKTRGVYMHLGVRPHGTASMPGIHSADFLPDENALITGMAVHSALSIEMLNT
jgi:amidohydrolase